MIGADEETKRRKQIKETYNHQHIITPQTIEKPIKDIKLDLEIAILVEKARRGEMEKKELTKLIKSLRRQMKKSTREFKFDQAIAFRNALLDLEKIEIGS